MDAVLSELFINDNRPASRQIEQRTGDEPV
jgi:hypothetical protein